MKETVFTPDELDFLREKRLFTEIGKHIKSSRAQTKDHISSKYVKDVLRGKVTRENETTDLIKERARKILDCLKPFENKQL